MHGMLCLCEILTNSLAISIVEHDILESNYSEMCGDFIVTPCVRHDMFVLKNSKMC